MANMGGFDPNAVPDDGSNLEPVPAGLYDLEIEESDIVEAKSGRGHLLKLTHRIVSGTFEGRKIWSQHNYKHENETAQNIGQREIANLCRAIGHNGPLDDSNDLHGIPYRARVVIEADKSGQYGPRNSIKAFLAPDGASGPAPRANTGASAPRNTPPPAAAAGNGSRPSWMNRGAAASR